MSHESSQYQLTAGICSRLNNVTSPDDALLLSCPTVQFLSFKKVPTASTNVTVDRYRIILSDGEHFAQAMLATQLNELIDNDQIGKHSIAVIEKFTCNLVQEKRLLIVMSLRIVAKDAPKIGHPTPLQTPVVAPPAVSAQTPASITPAPAVSVASSSTMATPHPTAAQPQRAQNKGGHSIVYPIESLSPYQNTWTIKARVIQKSDVKTWSNQRGEGKLFSVTFLDDSGEIRATGFNQQVDDLYDKLQVGKVYYVSKARVNLAKRKFSNVQNEYELTFERNTEVEECTDTTEMPAIKYNFVEIGKLTELNKDAICDVIGVVKEASQLGEITSKATSRTMTKRELTLVDQSGFAVRLTLWGKQAEQYAEEGHPVIAFRGVKVGEFGGRSLSMMGSSTMEVNPDIEAAHILRGWYDGGGAEQSVQSHTSAGGAAGGAYVTFDRAQVMPFEQVKLQELGTHDQAESFCARGTIMHIKADNIAYPACQTCNKKVISESEGWRCEKCNQMWDKPLYRYIIAMAVADWSGQGWLQGFNDVGELIIGMSADELVEIRDRDESQFNKVVENACNQTYNFACRAKREEFNDLARTRYSIQRILPLNYREESQHLVELLRSEWAQ